MLRYVAKHPLPIFVGAQTRSARRAFLQRKLRLLVCAILTPRSTDEELQEIISPAERYADGEIPKATLDATYWKISRKHAPLWDDSFSERFQNRMTLPLLRTVEVSSIVALFPSSDPASWWASIRCADRVREVFGNPFCQDFVAVPANLLAQSAPIQGIADDIYRNRAFDLMPVLGDALAEIGGIDGPLVAHCRSSGPHCKGCWALDFVLDVCRNASTLIDRPAPPS
jgi:hypothetical protein